MRQGMLISLTVVLLVLMMATPASAAPPVPVKGKFEAIIDSIKLPPTSVGNFCLLEVNGKLIFSGDLEGTASGTTHALVFASCQEVQTNAPGTFPDIFKSELELRDSESGEHIADITYQGKSEAGGEIEAIMILSNGLNGTLEVTDAKVAVGGSYSGFVKTD